MKFLRVISVILCLSLLLCSPCSVWATQTGEQDSVAVSSGAHSFDAAVPYLKMQEPVENATAVFLYETGTDTLMYAQSPDMQIYPSSLVKILTALMAVERGELTTVITADQQTLSAVPSDAVTADLKAGEQITLNDLLYCMMVGSANDAASVIAAHISGSEAAFVEEMNRYAEDLGCTASKFTNPHGLHDPEQVSTVRDLGRIVSAAIANEKFMTYFSEIKYTVPATNMSEERELVSKNFLRNNTDMKIYHDPRVTGGRTGIANDGSNCLAVSAESDGLSLVCILMGAESKFAANGNTEVYGGFKEITALMDGVFGVYRAAQIFYEGQTLRQYPVVNGANDVVAGAGRAVTTLLPVNTTPDKLDYRYFDISRELQAPVKKGQAVSKVEVWHNNMCVAQAELLAMNAVPVYTPVSQDPQKDSGGVLRILGGILLWTAVIGVAGVGILFLVRKVNVISTQRKREQERRKNRRRERK